MKEWPRIARFNRRVCPICEEPLNIGARRDAVFCSAKCRAKHRRQRQRHPVDLSEAALHREWALTKPEWGFGSFIWRRIPEPWQICTWPVNVDFRLACLGCGNPLGPYRYRDGGDAWRRSRSITSAYIAARPDPAAPHGTAWLGPWDSVPCAESHDWDSERSAISL